VKGTHVCPKTGCTAVIDNRLFACMPHWSLLSNPTKAAIYETAGKSELLRERGAAIHAAREEWGDIRGE
jgi:hypothetical protein